MSREPTACSHLFDGGAGEPIFLLEEIETAVAEELAEKLDERDTLCLWHWTHQDPLDEKSPQPARALADDLRLLGHQRRQKRLKKRRLDPLLAQVRDSMTDNVLFTQGRKRACVAERAEKQVGPAARPAAGQEHGQETGGALASWRWANSVELPAGVIVVPRGEL